ncbi:polysaccharide pyruvyl transferase family protein [Streptacidiphilus griseoplanus]|uniref:polysaccharide pyruvyl transferase family protein n=1 Tax=Peterkaempfera griseoplana TaxID=66896 RepID=UPI0006E1B462|nr:polysaccharide pyruvyl transferase family protein [Peterkaempfera griseoplana]
MSADAVGPHPPAGPGRVLLTGWFSFLHGEATAGDVLALEAVRRALDGAGIPHDTAWSPAFRPDGLSLDRAAPDRYRQLVFVCGPVHSVAPGPGITAPLLDLHRRFRHVRRIAVGVSVLDPDDPAQRGFDRVLPRDGAGPAVPDLAAFAPVPGAVPVVGVILTGGQAEYGSRRRHEQVARTVGRWLRGLDAARLPLDTRLDTADWRSPATPGQLHSLLARLDAVVTTRLHGLVLPLRAGVPVVAVDPVAGSAKVSAQARALRWPALLGADETEDRSLDRWLRWCLSADGRALARRTRLRLTGTAAQDAGLPAALLRELGRSPG